MGEKTRGTNTIVNTDDVLDKQVRTLGEFKDARFSHGSPAKVQLLPLHAGFSDDLQGIVRKLRDASKIQEKVLVP